MRLEVLGREREIALVDFGKISTTFRNISGFYLKVDIISITRMSNILTSIVKTYINNIKVLFDLFEIFAVLS